ncbi:protoporphyrinogen/coproporphyrinogen oxidase [Erythrobacter rubeus]|uniref:protoporphyrinogen/coproporphyrinogen oxidase n=1 Tax=Erythrobacter rubeus TaxID=2760803 RepID=UPI0018F8BBA1|nr:NAD(P)-binding protein [Erythrobacter rubeus]
MTTVGGCTLVNDPNIAIIGAGFAGFGASHQLRELGVEATIYEKRSVHGGHTSTHSYDDGFLFDEGPHISFTQNKRLQELFAESIGGTYEKLRASVNNYWQGHWIKHPAQVNLHGLPHQVVIDSIKDFVAASHAPKDSHKIENYEDWLIAAFGKTFAETFPAVYTRKYHTTDAKNLTTDWLGPRLYRPELEEVLRGALVPQAPDVHYVDHFRYPTEGGFVSYLNGFRKRSRVECDSEIVEIDPKAKSLRTSDGRVIEYDSIISSVPLPRLIRMIKGAPPDVVEAAGKLACTEVVLVNIGVSKPHVRDDHWTYFYDEDIAFARLSYPSNFSPNVAPKGCTALQAEVYFSDKWKPRDKPAEAYIEPVIDGLLKAGLIDGRDQVVHTSTIVAPFANIIFDHDRPAAVKLIHGYLDDIGVGYCGRFGDWGYIWTDQAFASGEKAARRALDRMAKGEVAAGVGA